MPDTMTGYGSPRPVLLATAARDAQRSGRCALCRHAIWAGDRIATTTAGHDAHVSCITAAGRGAVRGRPA